MVIEDLKNLKSIKDIVTSAPSFIIKWGMMISLLVITTIILISAKVKYPELKSIKLIEPPSLFDTSSDILILKCEIPFSKIKKGDQIIIIAEESAGNKLIEFNGSIDYIHKSDNTRTCEIFMRPDNAFNRIALTKIENNLIVKANVVYYQKTFLEAILTNLKILN